MPNINFCQWWTTATLMQTFKFWSAADHTWNLIPSAEMLRKCKMVCLPTECCSHQVSKKSINYKWHTSKYSIVEKLAGQAWTRTGKKLAVAFGGSTPLATQNCRVVWDILRTLSPSRWPWRRLRNSNFACRQHKKPQDTYKYQHSKATFWFCLQHRRWFWLHFFCPKEGDSNVQPKHWYHTTGVLISP